MWERTYIVTTFIKKLKKGEKEWVLSPQGFKRVSDDKPVDISKLPEDDKGLYYKDEPYTTKKLQQRFFSFTNCQRRDSSICHRPSLTFKILATLSSRRSVHTA